MKELFFMGGAVFMGILTILLVISTAWIMYHFIIGYNSKSLIREELLRKLDYGKSIGLFAMIIGVLAQLIGLYSMFSSIEDAIDKTISISSAMIFGAIKVTMLSSIYGILIYLFSFVLCFVANNMIERKLKK